MRILALDVGDKRIGVAISDELEISAHGLTTITRSGLKKEIRDIQEIVSEYNVEEIVVGMPVMMNGSVGIQAEKVGRFVDELKRDFRIPIKLFDERLSTRLIEKTLIAADMSREKRKKVIDKLSAVIILQDYMSSRGGRCDLSSE
ncbi:MAG: Holliday junction resolvase RuvX [Nitrospirae bacterium]|nr:Holliday junction resolvase RuvX [Nitrospirota bacterium]